MSELSALQIRLLEMFGWFDSFCRENNLKYYCLGGTMLGAVRHQGFIPWDDDIDVGMPREDYQKLAQIFGNRTIDKYCLETESSDSIDYCYPISKLYDTTTTLIEKKRVPIKRGIFIDIFPLDGAGDSEVECAKLFKPVYKKYNQYLLSVVDVRKGRGLIKNIAVIIARLFFKNSKNSRVKLNRMCANRSMNDCQYGGNFFGAWRLKELMPVSYYGNPVEYTFNGLQVFGVEKYDEYLTHMYGNWRQLPPEEKRVTHHDFIELNLEKSYLE